MSQSVWEMDYPYSRVDLKGCAEEALTESTRNGSKSRRICVILLSAFIWTILVGISGFFAGQNSTPKHAPQIERKWALTCNLKMRFF